MMQSVLTRSTLLAASIAVALGSATAVAQEDTTLVVVSWGGAYSDSQREAYIKPYEAMNENIDIIEEVYNGGLAQIRAQVESGNVTWNLVDLELADAVRGCDEGLLEELDHSVLPPAPDGTPAAEDFLPIALQDCAVGTIVWSTVVAYDDTKFPENKPSTIADFFDLEAFPGKRGLRRNPKVNLEWALMADGVPLEEVYDVLATPEGVDRAFAKLDTIKDEVLWWEAGAQPPQLLADGEVAMTSAYNGRLFNAMINEGKPFVIVWDGQIWDLDLWGIPVDSPNQDAAMEFVKFSTDTQRLADQAKYISYGPVRQSSLPMVDAVMQPHMPTAPENFANSLQNDYEFWANYQDELNERFSTWLQQ